MSDQSEDLLNDRVRELSDRFAFHLERWAHGRTPAWASAEIDAHAIVHDTLVEVARRTLDHDALTAEPPLARIRRSVHDRVVDRIRVAREGASDGRGAPPVRRAPAPGAPPPGDPTLETELLDRYESALARLKAADRVAIIARAELELPWSEVIEILGKPGVAAARMTVSRAVIRLAREMSHEHNG